MKTERTPHEKGIEHSSRVAATAKPPKQQMGLKYSEGWGNTAKAVKDVGRKQPVDSLTFLHGQGFPSKQH